METIEDFVTKSSQPSIDSCPTDNSHIVFPAPPLSTVLPDQIYFFPPERDKEMKINDKISSQSIKQNERSALKGQIK